MEAGAWLDVRHAVESHLKVAGGNWDGHQRKMRTSCKPFRLTALRILDVCLNTESTMTGPAITGLCQSTFRAAKIVIRQQAPVELPVGPCVVGPQVQLAVRRLRHRESFVTRRRCFRLRNESAPDARLELIF